MRFSGLIFLIKTIIETQSDKTIVKDSPSFLRLQLVNDICHSFTKFIQRTVDVYLIFMFIYSAEHRFLIGHTIKIGNVNNC